jgi:hypothetical protein
LVLQPTASGLLRRDWQTLGLAGGIPTTIVFSFFVPSYRPWWSVIGAAAITTVAALLFIRAARSLITTDGAELRSRTVLNASVSCRLTDDVKRFAWLDVFRLAEALGRRRCEGVAMPYLAFVACGSRRHPSERGTLASGGAWPLVQRLIHEGATGKLILNGRSGESWLYFIRGRNLRLEEDWPRDVTPQIVSASQAYEFQASALSADDISLVIAALEDKWLSA